MSKAYIPTHVDPFRFADNAAIVRGLLPLSPMQRLGKDVMVEEGDEVVVHLQFGVDEQAISYLQGRVEANLKLVCQRCLELFTHAIASDFTYGLINTEKKITKLPKSYEPYLVKEDILDVAGLVEEELIINLPIVPMHDHEQCKVSLPIVMVDDPAGAAVIEQQNPFKVIELLKVKSKQSEEKS